MPKAKDKENIRKKQRSANGTHDRIIKKKLVRSSNITDGIEVSKTLAAKMMTKTKVKTTRVTNTSIQNFAPRICGNGKPMPSLAELEKMFEDSEDDIDDTPCNALKRCKTPEQTSSSEKVPVSPTTLKNITHKVMDYISNLTVKNDLSVEEPPPPPIVPQKRHKKSDIPYIVGCVNRPQVPWNPKKKKFGVGEDEYGVIPSSGFSSEEENKQVPAKRRRRSKKVNLSKSIFNANTDEIVRLLVENDSTNLSESSTDSNQTITYDINNSSCSPENNTKLRRFSPLPSTSNDHETFLKNHEIFEESLKCNSTLLGNTSLLDDNSSVFDSKALSNDTDVELLEVPCETIILDDEKNNESSSVQVIEDTIQWNNKERENLITSNSPILIDDYYSSVDLNCTYDTDVCEVTDVDDVLAENNAIINKYRKNSDMHSVTCVQPYIMQEQNSTAITVNDSDLSEVVKDNLHAEPIVMNSSGIEQVVTNFFKDCSQPQNISDTIDLTKTVQNTRLCNKITSWVKVMDKQFKNKNNESTNNIDNIHQHLMNPNTQIVNTNIPITCTVTSVSTSSPITSYLMDLTDNVTSTTASVTRPSRQTKNNVNNSIDRNKLITPVKVTAGTSTPKSPQTLVQSSRSIGDCPICMENLSTKQVASTICGHIFCMDCIKSAIKKSGKRCPSCRKALRGVGYHQLFL